MGMKVWRGWPDRLRVWMSADNRAAWQPVLILGCFIILVLLLELVLNLWCRAALRRAFSQDLRPETRLSTSMKWLSLADFGRGRIGWLKVRGQNCRIAELKYRELTIDNRGLELDWPSLLRERRLRLKRLGRTRAHAVVAADALQSYLATLYPDLHPRLELAAGRLRLGGTANLFGSPVQLELAASLSISSGKKVRLTPLGLWAAGREVAPGLVRFLTGQIPLEFAIMQNWPLELTRLTLKPGALYLALKESGD